ncbi:MAG: hypothetical protein ACKO96_07880, partial [Flammeovirgaceae bacterium]
MESLQPKTKSRLTLYIIIALVVGIGLGFALNKSYVADENKKLLTIAPCYLAQTTTPQMPLASVATPSARRERIWMRQFPDNWCESRPVGKAEINK